MKKFSALLLVLLMSFAVLVSCGDEGGEQAPEKEKIDYGTATVFAPGDTVQIIAPTTAGRSFADYFAFHLDPMLDEGEVIIGSMYSQNADLEIIVGYKDESRPATIAAYKHLERIEKDSYFDARYVVYASSGTLVFAYDENELTNLQVIEVVEEKLMSLVKEKDYIALPEGVVMSGKVDLVDEQEELDRIQLDEEWAALEAYVGKEATEAFRLLYSMYDDRMVEWAANLYDPGVGGFYTCTSGRDGAEFGPDVECTVQILRFFASSGMLKNLSDDWTDFLPEKMQQQMIYFAKSLQHTNGYFYHPQWGKEATDGKLSRRGRDLGWATSLLSGLDSAPPYRAANGTAGDGVTADEYWQSLVDAGLDLGPKPYSCKESPTEADISTNGATLTSRLGQSTVNAVYDVILVSDVNPDDPEVDASTAYLNSYTAFIDYLLVKVGPQYDANPYGMGNTMNATKSQITTKSNELETTIGKYVYTEGDEATSTSPSTALYQFKVNVDEDSSNDVTLADIYKLFSGMSMKEMTIFMLNEKINPEIGLWGKTSDKNPTGTEFLFTNGYFKTIGLYSEWGYSYPPEYIPMAANALTQGLLGDQPSTTNICEVYNIWTGIDYLKSNLKYLDSTTYATDEAGNVLKDDKGEPITLKAKVKADVDKILKDNMAAAVINTYNKVSGYKQPDGGFDHAYERTGGGYASQQGLPTGLRRNDQSNIDATCIGSTGLTREIFAALGISGLRISIHTESDWMRAIEIFMSQTPVIKYSYDGNITVDEYHDYEADIPGAAYLSVSNNSVAENSFTQVTLGGDGVGLLNKPTAGKQLYLDWKINHSKTGATAAVFETDIMFKDIDAAKDAVELRFYAGTSASATRIYTLYLYADGVKEGSTVYAAPKSQKSQRVEIGKVGEWLNISFVYCEASGTGETDVPACFKLYVNGAEKPVIVDPLFENEVKGGLAASTVGFARFLTMSAFRGKIYLDDTKFGHDAVKLVKEEYTHNGTTSGGSGSGTTTPALPNTGSTAIAKDGVLTFDGVTAFPINYTNGFIVQNASQSAWNGYISAEKEGENGFIRINDLYPGNADTGIVDGGQPIITVKIPDSIEKKDTLVVELKLRISALADGTLSNTVESLLDLTLRSPKPDKPSDVQRVYQTYFGKNCLSLNSDTKNCVKDVVPSGEWFTLKLEYTVIGDTKETASYDVKAYINGNLVQESTAATAKEFANTKSVTQVAIILSKAFRGNLDIDDVSISYK